MFSQRQLQSINKTYFNVISATAGCIVIQSNNTGHVWAINGSGVGDGVRLKHKHKLSDPWHDQAFYIKGRHDLQGAFRAIRFHDEYYIQRKRRTRKHE